ncbi:OmpA family protein [Sulfurimonas xiamenensis]|jgi:OOP family OmpA-OmpF porin|uniref:OmpA family protein n=1 Tax=Sulfurimonas xiamenensis TaxID=2590021 RepID=A0AAJ4A5I9_9BACT|nr:OmpA family protein [Sulfurimonas xiamenensis]QFR44098.1 OmpA family protein [Sulfurimonas xiamenensis]
MRKLLLVPALLLSSVAIAQEYNYEITPVVGYNIAEGNLELENQTLYGAEVQYNGFDSLLKPELSVLYSDADYENSTISTDIYRIALNGVYEYDAISFIKPLAKIGFGYETIDNHLADNTDSIFLDMGVGAKVPFTDAIALKLEAVYMLKNNHSRMDSNLALLAGLNFAFGPKAQEVAAETVDGDDDNDGVLNSADKCPSTPAGVKVDAYGCEIDGDDDNDGVLNSRDRCPNTIAGAKVDSAGCEIDGDDDKDGVLNSKDKCPNTPAGNVVDSDGCTQKVNLHINFETASYTVDEASKQNVKKFADFLKARTNFNAKIIGHTDNVGSEASNQTLSENRANAVKELIVQHGIEANRIKTVGMGESAPAALNDTDEGRAQNRRIEAELLVK